MFKKIKIYNESDKLLVLELDRDGPMNMEVFNHVMWIETSIAISRDSFSFIFVITLYIVMTCIFNMIHSDLPLPHQRAA